MRMIGRLLGWGAVLVGLALFFVQCWFGAALIGALVPANAGWREAASGIRIYVIDNGVHTDLVLPATTPEVDWRRFLKPGDLRDPRAASRSHVAFGWGDREFYVNTPDWSRMTIGRVVRALSGGGITVMHVSHLAEPQAGTHVRAVTLTRAEYLRLARFVADSFDPAGLPAIPGYGAHDSFHAARGGYSAIVTCNEWTGRALRAAGVRIGLWTPLSPGVMFWLPDRARANVG